MNQMTPEQMRELDAFIAEKVMGWTNVQFVQSWNHGLGAWQGEPPKGKSGMFPPHYTTSPADAMAVLEKCAEKCGKEGWNVQIIHEHDFEDAPWAVSHEGTLVAGEAKTLPLAMVLFAKQLFGKAEQ